MKAPNWPNTSMTLWVSRWWAAIVDRPRMLQCMEDTEQPCSWMCTSTYGTDHGRVSFCRLINTQYVHQYYKGYYVCYNAPKALRNHTNHHHSIRAVAERGRSTPPKVTKPLCLRRSTSITSHSNRDGSVHLHRQSKSSNLSKLMRN